MTTAENGSQKYMAGVSRRGGEGQKGDGRSGAGRGGEGGREGEGRRKRAKKRTFPDNIMAVSSRVRRILHVLNGIVAHVETGVVHCALSDSRGVHASDARNRAAVKHGRVLEVAKTHAVDRRRKSVVEQINSAAPRHTTLH